MSKKVSIGEMGGRGLGHWEGVPMAFLLRWALEEAETLEKAVAVFRDNPRTCEYYYVIADGKTGKGVGMVGSWDRFETIAMGERHERLPVAVKDAVLLSADDRYKELARRVQAGHGTFDAESARAPHGPAGGDEVEPAQRALRDDHDAVLGRERLEGGRACGDAAVSRVQAERAARAFAVDLGAGLAVPGRAGRGDRRAR